MLYIPADWAHRAVAEGPTASFSIAITELADITWLRRGIDVSAAVRQRFEPERFARDRVGLVALFREAS